jgi:hypothetical protein
MWKDGTFWLPNGMGFYAAIIVYNTSNGIGSVEQSVGGKWVALARVNHLGNMYKLVTPDGYRNPTGGTGKSVSIRVKNKAGQLYGTYSVKFSCGASTCTSPTDAASS